jgi:16S rRNA (guanine966-N2)-methyltransferase
MRVISGSARGRPLIAPKGLDVRPTTDKVKGAMFSMLDAEAFRRVDRGFPGGSFPFAKVLDLYAGTGALGIEALSRGADHADFVESSSKARAALQANLTRTGLAAQAAVHQMRAELAVSTFRTTYDLILLDPPYQDPAALALLATLGQSTLVGHGTLVVLEHARSTEAPTTVGRLRLSRTRYHGDTGISLYESVEPTAEQGSSPADARRE